MSSSSAIPSDVPKEDPLNESEESTAEDQIQSETQEKSSENPQPVTETSFFFLHLRLLLWKNYKLFTRSFKLTLFQLATPVFFCLLIVYLQWLSDSYTTLSMDNPVHDVGPVRHCLGEDCVTVGYGIIGDKELGSEEYEWIEHAMKYVAAQNGLSYGRDVKLLTVGKPSDFSNYILSHQNQTLYGVLFCTKEWSIGNVSVPCKFDQHDYEMKVYTLYFNFTLEPDIFLMHPITPAPTDRDLLRLKLTLDNGIMEFYGKKYGVEPPKIKATTSNFPMPADRFLNGFSVIAFAGPFYFLFTPMVTFMILLIEITKEKEQRLRHGLSVMGLKASSFWLSWFITGIVLSFLATTVLVLMGHICRFEVFLNTPIWINFALFLTFSLAMMMLAFFMSTVLNSERIAYAVSFLFLLTGVVLQVLLSNVLIVYMLFYPEEMLPWVLLHLYRQNYVVRFIFSLYPPFSFSKAFGDIARVTSSHYSPEEFRWIQGRDYKLSDLMEDRTGTLELGIKYLVSHSASKYWQAPGPIYSFLYLLVNAVVFGVLAWYFDHVLASNRGIAEYPRTIILSSRHPLFFLTKKYWCSSTQRAEVPPVQHADKEKDEKEAKQAGTAELEKEKVMQQERENAPNDGIRIVGIDKVFSQGVCKRRTLHALKKVYMDISQGELLALLGHNGAGKSTLINILTGILGCTAGTAKICGFDLNQNIAEIQHLIGLVPQFDILWGELTAGEHLRLFAKLRGIPEEQIPSLVKQRLAEVNLEHVENALVRTFSGGMKRRLSVSICGIGNPKIIIMDEPTTGMDPVNKRAVWKLIRNMKRGKVFILTTHQMEEADVLADRVAIVVDGEIRCIGTPLFLKNHYGEGYRLSLVTEPSKVAEVQTLLSKLFPSAKLIDESGGSMVYSVPMNDLEGLKPIFGLMERAGNASQSALEEEKDESEDYAKLKKLVKDVGVSHPTLEEVFMRVTSKKERKNLMETLAAAAAIVDS